MNVSSQSSRGGPKGSSPNDQHDAFTRTDLCVVLGVLVLITSLVWPALADSRTRVDRVVCISNLDAIGVAYNSWAAEHGNLYPFLLPASEGGIRTPYNGLENNSWFQFSWISNELKSARVLACPADAKKHPVDTFATGTNGLIQPGNLNNCISYFLTYPTFPTGHRMLAGDRNITPNNSSGCSVFGFVTAAFNFTANTSPAKWNSELHRNSGNILIRDGSVEQTATFTGTLIAIPDDGGQLHLLMP